MFIVGGLEVVLQIEAEAQEPEVVGHQLIAHPGAARTAGGVMAAQLVPLALVLVIFPAEAKVRKMIDTTRALDST